MLLLGQMGENMGLHKVYAAIFEIFIFCPFLGDVLAIFAKNGQKMA